MCFLDNILIFGSNSKYNKEVATLLKDSFEELDSKTQIVDYSEFLLFSAEKKKNKDYTYIITCDNAELSAKNLTVLRKNTSTQILFKIEGLNWKFIGKGVSLSKSATKITESLGIRVNNRIALGLLASLKDKEFCIYNNGQATTKRSL